VARAADPSILGWVLVAAGVLDVLTAVLVLGPRLPEPRRPVVLGAVLSGGVLMALLGGCFLAGLL
jgi:hypothetical protein